MRSIYSIALAVFGFSFMPPSVFAAEHCAGITPDAEVWASEKLNEVKVARVQGDYDRAGELLNIAATGIPRLVDVSIPSRCMGKQNWQRYYKEKQLTYLELGRRAEKSKNEWNGLSAGFAYYVNGDNRSDVERILNKIPDKPNQIASAGNKIRGHLSGYDWALDKGFILLAEEQSGRDYYQVRLDRLMARSRSRSKALLRSESEIISSDITEEEAQIQAAAQDVTAFLGSMIGEDSLLPSDEAQFDTDRAERSLIQLGEAHRWLSWITTDEVAPILIRAKERGDVMLARANDTAVGFEARDDYYATAINYYQFANAYDKATRAKTSREAIIPALAAERAEREAKFDAKAAQMQESMDNFEQSMEKSAAEKESFKNEADSLEAELDL